MITKQHGKGVLALTLAATIAAPRQALSESSETDSADEEEVDTYMDMSLDDLLDIQVTTAAKTEQSIDAAPSIIDVITSKEIQERGYRSVAEALRSVPGMVIIDDHLNINTGVRGIFSQPSASSDIIKLMINGQPVAFRPTSANVLGPELIPIQIIERIEVIRGPTSALYGANAFLGVINVITKSTSDLKGKSKFEHRGGTDGIILQNQQGQSLNGGLFFSGIGSFRRLSYAFAATFNAIDRSGLMLPGLDDIIQDQLHTQNPQQYAPAKGYPTPGFETDRRLSYRLDARSRRDRSRVGSAYATVEYDLKNHGQLMLDGNFQYFDKHGEFQDYSVLTHKNRIAYTNSYVRLSYKTPTLRRLSARMSATYAWGSPLDWERIYTNDDPRFYFKRETGYSAIDLAVDALYSFSEEGDSTNEVTFGLDYTMDQEDLLTLRQIDETTAMSNLGVDYGKQNFNNLGVYLQWNWSPFRNLAVTLGSRFDRNSAVACNNKIWNCLGDRGDTLVPSGVSGEKDTLVTDRGEGQISNRVALVYRLPFLRSHTKMIYGSSFKPPSPYQLYHRPLTPIGSSIGDPSLKPQSAESWQLSFGSRPTERLLFSMNFFRTVVNDMVLYFRDDFEIVNRNSDVSTIGLELTASAFLTPQARLFGNVSYLASGYVTPKKTLDEADALWKTSSLNTTVPIGMYPTWIANLGVSLTTADDFSASLLANYVGTRRASLTNNQLYSRPLQETYTLADYFFIDLALAKSFARRTGHTTVVKVAIKGAPGEHIDPGQMGVDIPSLGPMFYFTLEHIF